MDLVRPLPHLNPLPPIGLRHKAQPQPDRGLERPAGCGGRQHQWRHRQRDLPPEPGAHQCAAGRGPAQRPRAPLCLPDVPGTHHAAARRHMPALRRHLVHRASPALGPGAHQGGQLQPPRQVPPAREQRQQWRRRRRRRHRCQHRHHPQPPQPNQQQQQQDTALVASFTPDSPRQCTCSSASSAGPGCRCCYQGCAACAVELGKRRAGPASGGAWQRSHCAAAAVVVLGVVVSVAVASPVVLDPAAPAVLARPPCRVSPAVPCRAQPLFAVGPISPISSIAGRTAAPAHLLPPPPSLLLSLSHPDS